MPKPPPFWKLVGPSFIILGVGLGSGELILWPYLSANFGLGIIWAAIVGITLQFFSNMEIERYALVTGESVFVGLARKFGRKWSATWFMLTTLVPWIWPGIMAAAATVIASSLGIPYSGWLAVGLLLLLGGIYGLGKVVYRTQETVQKGIILIGVPFVFLLTVLLTQGSDWGALIQGIVGRGRGYRFLPPGLPIATFLAALAYAGAGGNLNLAQSLYVREKGYGMGKYAGKLDNLLTRGGDAVTLEGKTFAVDESSLGIFRLWWRRVNIEHLLIFWATGAVTILMLSVLAYATVYGRSGTEAGINFLIFEAGEIGGRTFPALGKLFLLACGVMLFGTQFSVYGSNSRMAAENLVIWDKERFGIANTPRYFFIFLWAQILAGVIVLVSGFTEPLALVVVGAVANAVSMFVYSALVLYLNMTCLDKRLRPGWVRMAAVVSASGFYGVFSVVTIYRYVSGWFH